MYEPEWKCTVINTAAVSRLPLVLYPAPLSDCTLQCRLYTFILLHWAEHADTIYSKAFTDS